jgi:hypothetical protein
MPNRSRDWFEQAPFEHYGPLQSGEAISFAREIVEFVRAKMA